MRYLLTALVLLALPACDPIGPLPGGALSGDIKASAIDWDTARSIDTFKLETRPGDPYSINIWGVVVEENFYVASGKGAESKWVPFLAANPSVRLKVGDSIHELRALRIEDAFELRAVRARYKEKYELEDDAGMAADETWVYRLDPR